MAELSAIPFNKLPSTDDGYTLLYDNDKVQRSNAKLSELVQSAVNTKTVDKLDTTAFSAVSGDFLTEQDLNGYATEEWVKAQNYISSVDLSNYYQKTETSGKDELTAAFDKKQDVLDFTGINGAITAINNSAFSGAYVALNETRCIIGKNNVKRQPDSVENYFMQGTNNSGGYYRSFAQGENNSCTGSTSFAQGDSNIAGGQDLVQGTRNIGAGGSLVQGQSNYATQSLAQGGSNSAKNYSLAQGLHSSAVQYSMAQGYYDFAADYSMAQGNHCVANSYAQAFGLNSIMTDNGMAIGQYNKTTADAAFVIGNGTSENERNDALRITKTGDMYVSGSIYVAGDVITPQGGGGATGAYVPLNAVECTIGSGNSSISCSLAQGENNLAGRVIVHPAQTIEGEFEPEYSEILGYSLAQGKENSAYGYSITQGYHNKASNYAMAQGGLNVAESQSFAQGYYNTASQNSFAQGYYNKAYSTGACFGSQNSALWYSFTQGDRVTAYNYSFAAGQYNSAENYSQTFGYGLKATNYATAYGYEDAIITYGSFVIGEFNKTTAAPFVIGNGTSDNNRKDLFVIDKDGNVSAQGQIYAVGGVLGAALDTLELAPDNETIEFVTSSHNVVNSEGEPEEYTVIKIKTSLVNKLNELYNLVASNSGTSNWNLPQ